MSLTLYLDRRDWFQHMEQMEKLYPGCVPVIKGNGYGFGNEVLADAARKFGKREIAVGTVEEARQLQATHPFEQVIVLTPVMSELREADLVSERVYTVGSRDHLQFLVTAIDGLLSRGERMEEPFRLKLLLKGQSPMKRYGFSLEDAGLLPEWIQKAETDRIKLEIEGLSIHFPKEKTTSQVKEKCVEDWLETMKRVGLPPRRMYVSHLSSEQYQELAEKWPEVGFAMRLGTDLWLADKSFIETKSTVLDVQPISKGERFGYKQQRARKNGHLVFLAGGTANGVGLEAPTFSRGLKDWLKLTAFWVLGLFNRHLSPFTYRGKRLWFAEPPHMQTSVLLFPAGSPLPEVGEELPVQLRMTTASFDRRVETGEARETMDTSENEEKGNPVHLAL
ncbi:alanine racemase [Kroppenstedtia sanguinis]|uniref:Alanine racemase n=1 Tax=Kroppenstedtia sanguinis TaxID=1380684 RepID=A0ABW4C6Q3_9BACL